MHILPGYSADTYNQILRLAHSGKLAGATVINNIALANTLAQLGVRYVIYRQVDTDHDAGPQLRQTTDDLTPGQAWWAHPNNQAAHRQLDSRVLIQAYGLNELNAGLDGWFYLGLMQAADSQGRKLVIFTDSVGMPDVAITSSGQVLSAVWRNRLDSGCLAYAKSNNHFANLHEYGSLGAGFTGNEPGSAIFPDGHQDDSAFAWFGGRHQAVYAKLLTPDSRVPIIMGECGTSSANVATSGGLSAILSDIRGYQTRYGTEPYVVSCNYWTVGSQGWAQSSIDEVLPLL